MSGIATIDDAMTQCPRRTTSRAGEGLVRNRCATGSAPRSRRWSARRRANLFPGEPATFTYKPWTRATGSGRRHRRLPQRTAGCSKRSASTRRRPMARLTPEMAKTSARRWRATRLRLHQHQPDHASAQPARADRAYEHAVSVDGAGLVRRRRGSHADAAGAAHRRCAGHHDVSCRHEARLRRARSGLL